MTGQTTTEDRTLRLSESPDREIYVITDVHGCYLTLLALLEKLQMRPQDILIVAGDMSDRGDNIKEVLDYLLDRENTYLVLGNHDWMLVDLFNPGGYARNYINLHHNGLNTTIQQLVTTEQAREYAERVWKQTYNVIFIDDKYVVCHANYNWKKNEKFFIDSEGDGHLWHRINATTHAKYKGPVIVHGHTPCVETDVFEYTKDIPRRLFGINLDGGCFMKDRVPGACLRALKVSTQEIIVQPHCEVGVYVSH